MATEYNSWDITSSNAVAILTVQDLYPNGIQLQVFGSDSAITVDSMDVVEDRLTVDGYPVFGQIPGMHTVTINLEANSPSRKQLQTVYEHMANNRIVPECTLTIKIPSRGETFKYSEGALKSVTPMPSLEKVLGPTTWVFDFAKMESI